VKAVPGGFDSHALPPPASNKTPGTTPGVFYLINFSMLFAPASPLLVGPNQVVDIKWNDVKKRGDFASIIAFLGSKRAILGSLHREVRDQGSRVGSREYLDLYRRFLRPKWHYRDDKYLFLLSLSFDIRNVNA
jgi:hypothetical protein